MWINFKIREIAEKIFCTEKSKISNSISSTPKRLLKNNIVYNLKILHKNKSL